MRGVNNIKTIFLDTCRHTRMFNEDINFKHKCIHKYTWYITSGVMTVKSLIDIVLVRKNMLKWVNDVKTVKGLSIWELCKDRVGTKWARKNQVKKVAGPRIAWRVQEVSGRVAWNRENKKV